MKNVITTVSFLANLITILTFVVALLGVFQVVQVTLPVPENWRPARFVLFLYPVLSTVCMIYVLRDLMDRQIPSYLLACVFVVAYPVVYAWLATQFGLRAEAAPYFVLVYFANAMGFWFFYYMPLARWGWFSFSGQLRWMGLALLHLALSWGAISTLDPEFLALQTNRPLTF